jgi:NADH:ubiquinone oxidoreductase subunit
MKNFLLQIFTWWNGQTIGTRYLTWRHGKRVGSDEFGNVYYEGGMTSFGVHRRWVIYNGYADASKIPPGWFGWMQNKTDVPPSLEGYTPDLGRSRTDRIRPDTKRLSAQGLSAQHR